MSWKSLRRSTPAVLLRHPVLLAEWLRLSNGLRRWREEHTGASIVIVAAVVLMAMGLRVFSSQLVAAIMVLSDYWIITTAVAALYAATTLAKRRRYPDDLHSQSWLIATPIAPSSVRLSNAIRAVAPVLARFSGIATFILAAQGLGGGIDSAAGAAIAAIAGGILVGGLIGGFAKGEPGQRFEGSRYVPRAKAKAALKPDGSALANWPIAQVLAWSRPENSRYLLVVALLAVQGGSSAVTGLSVVAIYFLGGYLTGLLSAMLQVAKSSALWLRSTPMTLSDFVWTLSRQVLLHQALGSALAAIFMLLLGAPVSMALQVAALWLVLVISISGFALVDSYRGRSPAVKIALSLATLVALATAWQLRVGAKA